MFKQKKDYSSPSVLPRIEEFNEPNQAGFLPDLTSVVERQRKKKGSRACPPGRRLVIYQRPKRIVMFLHIYKLHQDTMLDILQRQRQRQS